MAEQEINPLLPALKGREVIPQPTASGLTVTSSVEEGTVLCMHWEVHARRASILSGHPLSRKWTYWASLRDSGKASRSHNRFIYPFSVFKVPSTFSKGWGYSNEHSRGKNSCLQGFYKVHVGRETINKLVGKIHCKLDIDMCYGDNKARERESRMCWASGANLSRILTEELTQKVIIETDLKEVIERPYFWPTGYKFRGSHSSFSFNNLIELTEFKKVPYLVRVWSFVYLLATAGGRLVPRQGIKPAPPAVDLWSLNYWTTREVPSFIFKGYKSGPTKGRDTRGKAWEGPRCRPVSSSCGMRPSPSWQKIGHPPIKVFPNQEAPQCPEFFVCLFVYYCSSLQPHPLLGGEQVRSGWYQWPKAPAQSPTWLVFPARPAPSRISHFISIKPGRVQMPTMNNKDSPIIWGNPKNLESLSQEPKTKTRQVITGQEPWRNPKDLGSYFE